MQTCQKYGSTIASTELKSVIKNYCLGAQGDLNIGVCNKELCWGGRPKETWKLESVIKNSIRLVGAQGNLEDEVSR